MKGVLHNHHQVVCYCLDFMVLYLYPVHDLWVYVHWLQHNCHTTQLNFCLFCCDVLVLDNGLLNLLTAYAPHTGKPEEKKERFWNELFHLVSCIPQNEMVVLAGDMNGHVGSSNAGYDGTHGGFGYGDRNADGSRILEFADGLNLVVCNTLFVK